MVTLHQVYAGEELAAVQLVGEVEDAGKGVAVVRHRQVESAVVATSRLSCGPCAGATTRANRKGG